MPQRRSSGEGSVFDSRLNWKENINSGLKEK